LTLCFFGKVVRKIGDRAGRPVALGTATQIGSSSTRRDHSRIFDILKRSLTKDEQLELLFHKESRFYSYWLELDPTARADLMSNIDSIAVLNQLIKLVRYEVNSGDFTPSEPVFAKIRSGDRSFPKIMKKQRFNGVKPISQQSESKLNEEEFKS